MAEVVTPAEPGGPAPALGSPSRPTQPPSLELGGRPSPLHTPTGSQPQGGCAQAAASPASWDLQPGRKAREHVVVSRVMAGDGGPEVSLG